DDPMAVEIGPAEVGGSRGGGRGADDGQESGERKRKANGRCGHGASPREASSTHEARKYNREGGSRPVNPSIRASIAERALSRGLVRSLALVLARAERRVHQVGRIGRVAEADDVAELVGRDPVEVDGRSGRARARAAGRRGPAVG